ncbi:hypothetical protein GE21DRAFT_1308175 [Neurospora crassa]|nr:hypothetical protein B21J21.240 [imported] - Neurospora crassa [Neurospora crassa]KHE84912.1 hypothetical protein GE21DRAFT_1308175 [Neurospora crassa]
MESRPRSGNDSLLSLPSIAHDETTSPAQEIAPWSHPVAQFVSLGTCDGTNEFIANPCYPLRPPDQTPPACSEFRDWLRHQVQSGRCSKSKEAGERKVSVQPGGCFTGDDWLIHQFSSPEGVKLDQDGLPFACLLPLARLRFDTSASAPVRLHQNPGPFPPSAMVSFYGGSSPPLTMADMHGDQIMKFHRAYRHTVSAVRHEQPLPHATHARTEKPLPGWFPEVPGHLQQNGTSRDIAVTAGTRPRFDGIKSFGITWVPNGLGKTDSHPIAVSSLVAANCDKLD